MESFEELNLPEFLGKNLRQINFMKPTPVQAQAIPPALEGKDVIASAQTGTGKTGAFGIALLTYLEKNKDKTAMIMTPTRELAVQVLDVLRKLSGNYPLGGSVLLIGGANMQAQFMALKRKPRLVIGTPGRIIDHLNRGSLHLSSAGFLVLDEADRMLDMGFAPQLEEIRKKLPPVRQTLLFSATFPADIQRMANSYLKNPVRITIGATTKPVEKINQEVVFTTESRKFDQLMLEIKERPGSILIFARTQIRVDRINDRLKEAGLKVTRIHGGRTQSQRRQAIDQFREGRFLILVATDIAARGLDIHHIAHVINYDLPKNPEDYIHRIGRTARAGAEGNSICLLTPEDRNLWERILRLLGTAKESVKIKKSAHPGFMAARPASPARVNSFRPEGRAEDFRGNSGPRENTFRKQRESSGGRHSQAFPDRPRVHRDRDHHSAGRSEGFLGSKERHPDGRHQRRSEEHQQRLGKDQIGVPPSPRLESETSENHRNSLDSSLKHGSQGDSKFLAQQGNTPWGPTGSGSPSDHRPYRSRQGRGNKPFENRQDRGNRPVSAPRPFRKDFAPRARFEEGEINGNLESQNKSRNAFGESSFPGRRKHFGDRRPWGAQKSFGNRNGSFENRRPFNGEKKSFGDRQSFGERKSFGVGDRKPMGRPSWGERKPMGDRTSDRGGRSENAPFPGYRKSFGDRKVSGDRKPFHSTRRPWGEKKPFRPSGGGSGRPQPFHKPSGPRE